MMKTKLKTLTIKSILAIVAIGTISGLYLYIRYSPKPNPITELFFPSVQMDTSMSLMKDAPVVGDKVFILKGRYIGVITELDSIGKYAKVSYIDEVGKTKTGTFPYTVMQKIHILN